MEVVARNFSWAELEGRSWKRPRSLPGWVAREVLEMAELVPSRACLNVSVFAKVIPLSSYQGSLVPSRACGGILAFAKVIPLLSCWGGFNNG